MSDCDVSIRLGMSPELRHMFADQPHKLHLYDTKTAMTQTFSARFPGLRRLGVSSRPGTAVNACTAQF